MAHRKRSETQPGVDPRRNARNSLKKRKKERIKLTSTPYKPTLSDELK